MALDIKKIIVTAFLQLCAEKPFKEIKVTDILCRSGVGRQTFYNHFSNKDGLIGYIYDTYIWAMGPVSPDAPLSDYHADCLAYFHNMRQYKDLLVKVARSEKALASLRSHMETSADTWGRSVLDAHFDESVVPPVLSFSMRYLIHATVLLSIRYITDGMTETPEEMAACFVRFLPPPLQDYLPSSPIDRYPDTEKE